MSSTENNAKISLKTLIVLGSGGHTTEMVEIVKELDKTKYSPRIYVLAKSDNTSYDKIKQLEKSENNSSKTNNFNDDNISFVNIYRSRNVNQSYLTSIITTLFAIFECIPLCWRLKPDLILCNGPGTCVPICLVAYILKSIHIIPKCKIIFIESYCRVKTLSLSGKILLKIVDMFVVQWPELLLKLKDKSNVKYYGRLM